VEEFRADVQLMVDNCRTYNERACASLVSPPRPPPAPSAPAPPFPHAAPAADSPPFTRMRWCVPMVYAAGGRRRRRQGDVRGRGAIRPVPSPPARPASYSPSRPNRLQPRPPVRPPAHPRYPPLPPRLASPPQVSDVFELREAGYEVLDRHKTEMAEAEAMLALSE
jgi:hypothetical protein